MPKKRLTKKKDLLTLSISLNKQKIKFYCGLLLILLGLFLFSNFIYLQVSKYKGSRTTNEPIKISKEFSKKTESDPPVRILIPERKIDTSIVTAEIKNGYWETSETSASYGQGSAYPGEKGNSVIFAHTREKLFYNLKNVKKGDEILVFTKNKWYKYIASEIKIVYPNQTEVVRPTSDERLTLYTCSGYADEKRLIVVAKPVH